jgi:F-type H+-transporting ATPase subunit b
MSELIFPAINLAILVTIMVVKLRDPLRGFVRTRHETLRDELQRVRDLLKQSQTRYDEFTGKLRALEAEIVTLREQARQDAAQTKSTVLAEAQRLSAAIVTDARAAAQGMHAQFRHELLSEMGVRVIDRAEAMLKERLTGDDRARIRHEFSTQVERAQ